MTTTLNNQATADLLGGGVTKNCSLYGNPNVSGLFSALASALPEMTLQNNGVASTPDMGSAPSFNNELGLA